MAEVLVRVLFWFAGSHFFAVSSPGGGGWGEGQ